MLLKLIKFYWRPFCAIVLILTIVGVSFVYSTQTSEKIKIQAEQELGQQWRTDYDLLISPARETDQRHEPQQELVRRSDMGNHMGGISLDQYEQIKAMQGIEIAAPISFMGYIDSSNVLSWLNVPSDGIYIVDVKNEVFDGIQYRKVPTDNSFLGTWDVIFSYNNALMGEESKELSELTYDLGWTRVDGRIRIPFRESYFWSIIAVDPEAENKLLNLDQAIVEGENFSVQNQLNDYQGNPLFPILLQKKSFDVKRTVKIDQVLNSELLSYTSDPLRYKDELVTFVEQNDIKELERENIFEQAFEPYSEEFLYFDGQVNVVDGKLVKNNAKVTSTAFNPITFELGEIQSQHVGDLDGNPLYRAIPVGSSGEQINYRTLKGKFGDKGFGYDIYGIFDATLLNNPYSTSNEQKSPDFYNPDKVYITHDTEGNPLPERVEYQSPPSKEAYSTGGVDAITTLPAAEYLLGDYPISIIRVVVEGAGVRSTESMARVERIAEQIRRETGLTVDVMLGAADRKVQVLLEDFEGVPGYGYLLEGWSQAGASFVIEDRVNNTNLLLSGYIFMMGLLGVFLVYPNYAEVRRKDLLIQYTFGWKKKAIYKQLLGEASLIVFVVTFLLVGSKLTIGSSWTWEQFGFGLGLLLLIAILSICFFYILPVTKGLEKQVNLRSGGQVIFPFRTQAPSSSLWGYFWHTIIRYGLRSLLKFLLLLASVLYVFLFLLTKGSSSSALSLTFMGENIDLMLEPYQWVLFGFGLLLSLGSYIAIQMNQMQKRTQEIQLFQAWGWSKKKWLQLYFIEDLLLTIIALAIGIGGGYGLLSVFTQTAVVSGTSIAVLSLAMIICTSVILGLILSIRSKQNRLREFNY